MGFLTVLTGFVLIYLLSILFHEFGHFIAYMEKGDNARFSLEWISKEKRFYCYVGNSAAFSTYTKKQKVGVYMLGIIMGLIPIAFALVINSLALVLVIPYLMGCKSDFNKIYKLKHE